MMDLAPTMQNIEAKMRSIFNSFPPISLYGMMEYHLGWKDQTLKETPSFQGGKMLRGILTLLACQSLGGAMEMALPLAAAIELHHNCTLVLDDIEDNDRLRRGRPTVWSLWGIPHGINTGDAMREVAFLPLFELQYRLSPPDFFRLQERFVRTSLLIREGQFLDLSFEALLDVSEEQYLEMIEKKTAKLIECSTSGGAFLALKGKGTLDRDTRALNGGMTLPPRHSDDEAILGKYASFGLNLGLALQLQDDVIGIWGVTSQSGKGEAQDLRRKKKTLPLLYAMAHSTESERKKLARILSQKGEVPEAELRQILSLLEETHARQHVEKMARSYMERAVLDLRSTLVEDLADLADPERQRRVEDLGDPAADGVEDPAKGGAAKGGAAEGRAERPELKELLDFARTAYGAIGKVKDVAYGEIKHA